MNEAETLLSHASPGVRALNPSLTETPRAAAPSFTTRPSTDEAGLNKLETAYLEHLRNQDHAWLGVQNITLKLGHDVRYTPDFFTLTHGKIIAHETKGGFRRDDAMVKLRIAARLFPWIEFRLVTRSKLGVWQVQEIKP